MPNPPSIVEDHATWADGYGLWHVQLVFTASADEEQINTASSQIARYARDLIVEELIQREQTTSETRRQAESRIRRSLGVMTIDRFRHHPTRRHQLMFHER